MSASGTSDFAKRLSAATVFWEAKGSRLTSVRRIICEVVFTKAQPFDADQILGEARQTDSLISMASLYRTLKSLREAGLIEQSLGQKGYYQLRPVSETSSNCIACKNCGRIIPLNDPCLPIRVGAQVRQAGFKATHVRQQTEAFCQEFETTGECHRL